MLERQQGAMAPLVNYSQSTGKYMFWTVLQLTLWVFNYYGCNTVNYMHLPINLL
uniref:Uncharacterized protein n=1 Tax=Tetranychus urticae TaxID=32264 RepID=T1KZZ7_TETUR